MLLTHVANADAVAIKDGIRQVKVFNLQPIRNKKKFIKIMKKKFWIVSKYLNVSINFLIYVNLITDNIGKIQKKLSHGMDVAKLDNNHIFCLCCDK